MIALGIQQSIRMTQSAGSRVLMAIKPVVQAYEDVKKMDFGTEKSFLVKVRTKKFAKIYMLLKTFISSIGRKEWKGLWS